MFWFGETGCGKTHCANELARAIRPNRQFKGVAADLVDEVQATFNGEKDARTRFAMRRQIEESDVVLLDDLGRERDGFGQDVMFQLLDAALSSEAFVIVTANKTAKELAESYNGDDGLRSRLSLLLQREWKNMPHLRKDGGTPRDRPIERDEAHGPPVTPEQREAIHRKHGFDPRKLPELDDIRWMTKGGDDGQEGTTPTQAG